MKDADHIARINSKFNEDVVATVHTWQLSRVFRRDFNRMTYKMFLLAPKFNAQQRIILRLHEMQRELHVLENLAAKIPPPLQSEDNPPSVLSMRLVSPEARILFDVLAAMDVVMYRLLSQHAVDTTEEICADFFAAYGRLKYALFRKKPDSDKSNSQPDAIAAPDSQESGETDEKAPESGLWSGFKGMVTGVYRSIVR